MAILNEAVRQKMCCSSLPNLLCCGRRLSWQRWQLKRGNGCAKTEKTQTKASGSTREGGICVCSQLWRRWRRCKRRCGSNYKRTVLSSAIRFAVSA